MCIRDRQNEAKTVQTTENTKLNIAVVNEDKAVKLNDKEYNLGASYVKNIDCLLYTSRCV